MTIVSVLFFGVAGTLCAGFLFDIGYSIDPIGVGRNAAAIAGVFTFVFVAAVSYRDYHYEPSAHNSNR
ncbi:hypothetical protein C1X34_12590 [Pseudomonas sp. GW456-12-10-14-TSB6]|nr:hypothetical protein C1X55_31350 [Pseudomonas sp. GW460-C8]PMW23298.1 hypothetical protein C1X53_12100 [Pseudomonas sp. GW456-E6]PMW24226.1 hypothetical protein C1X40_05285 [Pseudomonas sp. GW456-11-11-14-TSB2]PMW40120.1 hypothetical protein C1X45_08595 [Pseudomonas sp. GW460-7]PMW41231.1 hypothetical protein C1X48_07230 [Pseudomonas sp. FW305-3-2-15-A-R2A1]PMW53685.1 hypothetical protein C1X31_29100 [Pseudomonas sp. GW456-11-11-14-LB2]PMW62824.1 hypothetical protein C1X39_04215 [Pseudomon